MKQEYSVGYRIALFLFTIFLAVGALWVTLNRDSFNVDGFRRWLRYGDLEISLEGETPSFTHGGGDLASYSLLKDGIVMVSRSGARYYSLLGEPYSERVISFQNPVLHRGNQNTVVYDAGGRVLLVYGEQKEKFSLNLGDSGTILLAHMNSNDWLVVVTQESGYKGIVTVYNKEYQAVMNVSLSTTYVMDGYLSPDNRKLAIVTVGQDKGEFFSKLSVYPVGEEDAEPMEQTFYGELVLDMDYEQGAIWLLCEKQLLVVNPSDLSVTPWTFASSYLKDCSMTGDGYVTLLLGQYRAGTADRMVTIDSSGQILGDLGINGTPLSVSSRGAYIAYLAEEKLTLYTPSLEEYAVFSEVRHANEVTAAEDGSVLLASSQEAWLFIPMEESGK